MAAPPGRLDGPSRVGGDPHRRSRSAPSAAATEFAVGGARHHRRMPLTLVLGPANSAKAGEVLGAFADASRRGAVLVVPTMQDAEHYARELAGEGTVLGRVLTFSGLAREIARRSEYDGVRLSALQREWAIRRAVAASPLKLLGESAGAPGFVEALGNLIAELVRSLIGPQRFARGLDAWALEDERRRLYADDLATLYLAYGRELERLGRVD